MFVDWFYHMILIFHFLINVLTLNPLMRLTKIIIKMSGKGKYDWLRMMDWFARPVGLRLDRNQNFGIPIGGIFTLITLILTLSFTTNFCLKELGNFNN